MRPGDPISKAKEAPVIVATRFDGDDDMHIQWLQHDVYGQALAIIADTCQRYEHFARAVLGDDQGGWEPIRSFDHRTLQHAHDILAAAWRFKHVLRLRQMKLPVDRKNEGEPAFINHWLTWLQEEVDSWIAAPYRVRLVVKILANQNEPAGYKAETDLSWDLLMGYYDVPWEQSLINAVESALESHIENG